MRGGLRAALGEVHRRYARQVNFRKGSRGYWRHRWFASVAMDEPRLLAAARYVELKPVAGAARGMRRRLTLVERACAHLDGRMRVAPLLAPAPRLGDVSAPGRSMGFGSAWSAPPTPNDQPIHRLSPHSKRHRRARR
jgi:putative transposase